MSTFISLGLHVSLIIFAYYGLPSFKVIQPIELPIDIVEDTPISSKTSLKLGHTKVKEIKKNKKTIKEENFKKTPPPPPLPSKKIIEKKNLELKKKKEIKEIAELVKKKPKLKIKKEKKTVPPKVVNKPEKIKKKQKENLAKGILNTLTKPEQNIKSSKKEKNKNNNNKEMLKKIKKIAGNSYRQVKQTDLNLSQTDINKIENHVRKFFNVSYAASELRMVITLKISANLDGTVKRVQIIDESLYAKNKFYRATADAARRAVLDSSPIPLPKGKEKLFENIEFDFNPSSIFTY